MKIVAINSKDLAYKQGLESAFLQQRKKSIVALQTPLDTQSPVLSISAKNLLIFAQTMAVENCKIFATF